MLKSSKHRCQCYSQESSSFLYGLRRDAPSTERVCLERLLNILSRAAAHKNRNPQRLWAESERPEWWTDVTTLSWKNPREHPKDNKETLKKKIDILERELNTRKLMTKELKEELETHRGSKKVDLELKSDFEAIIAKASGLHFMVDKVYSKMGESRIISDKMATYISETKSCLENINKRINKMYQKVQAREERKSTLWAKMGVSKQQQAEIFHDSDTASIMIPDVDEDCPDISNPAESNTYIRLIPSPSSPFSISPLSPLSPPSAEISQSDTVVSRTLSLFISSPCVSPHSQEPVSPLESLRPHVSTGRLPLPSQPALTEPETTHVTNLAQRHPVSPTNQPMPKRTWQQSMYELENNESVHQKLKSRKVQHTKEHQVSEDVVPVDDDDGDDDVQIVGVSASASSVPSRRASASSAFDKKGARKDGRTTADTETHLRKLSPSSYSVVDKGSEFVSTIIRAGQPGRQPSSPFSYGDQSTITSLKPESSSVRTITHGANIGTIALHAEESTLPSHVDVDAGEEDELDDVEEILEVSDRPTFSMYVRDTFTSDIDHLANMTTGLSCEDLSPSVMEEVMMPTPRKPTHLGMAEGRPQTTSRTVTASRKQHPYHPAFHPSHTFSRHRQEPKRDGNGGKSLSRAIGDLSGDFPH